MKGEYQAGEELRRRVQELVEKPAEISRDEFFEIFDALRPGGEGDVTDGTARDILEACEETILSAGIQRLSVRAVANRSGIMLASLQYHYKTKDALIAAFLDWRLGIYYSDLRKIIRRNFSNPEKSLRFFYAYMIEDSIASRTQQLYIQLWALSASNEVARLGLERHMFAYHTVIVLLMRRYRMDLSVNELHYRAALTISLFEGLGVGGQALEKDGRVAPSVIRRITDSAMNLMNTT